jgi:hypothetical protein
MVRCSSSTVLLRSHTVQCSRWSLVMLLPAVVLCEELDVHVLLMAPTAQCAAFTTGGILAHLEIEDSVSAESA